MSKVTSEKSLRKLNTGADLVAEFIARYLCKKVFLVTGGACAFIVDAIGRNEDVDYVCFQHEQAASMAADAVWRITGKMGVTVSTSGPGATNLITGIACSWFDSIPAFHITGQVNTNESSKHLGVKVRQAGFQETDIVTMVSGITKYTKRVSSISELMTSLREAYLCAISDRMGPVLIDIPMDVQKQEISDFDIEKFFLGMEKIPEKEAKAVNLSFNIQDFLSGANRPLVLIGGGAVLSGSHKEIEEWCKANNIPYVSSWASMPSLDRASDLYFGSIGVYGSRLANWILQAADKILVLGSRLDNRQRTANPRGFAPFAQKLIIDIDQEELYKYKEDPSYRTIQANLKDLTSVLETGLLDYPFNSWLDMINLAKCELTEGFEAACPSGGLNPYYAVRAVQDVTKSANILVSDCGANLCWVYQALKPSKQILFTAGGNSPMGYSLPAAIGAQQAQSDARVVCFIGDGGLQMNIQELQTIVNYSLPIQIFIQNNFGYGIIKQFQDAYFEGRHHASGYGYSVPSFRSLADAYKIEYVACSNLDEIMSLQIDFTRPRIIELVLPQDALITPKVEMNRFLHDQFPYEDNNFISRLPYPYPERPTGLIGSEDVLRKGD